MSDNVMVNTALVGTAGAGVGLAVAGKQTAELVAKADALNVLKQPIIDKFQKFGYTEGMDIGKEGIKKVFENYNQMLENGLGLDKANSKKALGKVYDKTVAYLKKMQTSYNTEISKIDTPLKKITDQIKNIKVKNALIGAGVAVGLYTLYNMVKPNKQKEA